MFDVVSYALFRKQIAGVMPGYKGTVAAVSDLPSSATEGDLYVVTGEGNAHYFWNGTEWLCIDPDIATNAEIDGLYS